MQYQFNKIEEEWQKYWADHKTFAAIDNSVKPKFYALVNILPLPPKQILKEVLIKKEM